MTKGIFDPNKEKRQLGVMLENPIYLKLKSENLRCQTGTWASFFKLVSEVGVKFDPVCNAEGHDTVAFDYPETMTVCRRCKRVLG